MHLKVEPADLDAYAAQIERADEALRDGTQYVDKHGTVAPCNLGIFGVLVGAHTGVADDVKTALQRLSLILKASHVELSKAADYYRKTDLDTARRFDAMRPTTKR